MGRGSKKEGSHGSDQNAADNNQHSYGIDCHADFYLWSAAAGLAALGIALLLELQERADGPRLSGDHFDRLVRTRKRGDFLGFCQHLFPPDCIEKNSGAWVN
jgi:hypothetical protein